VRCWLKHKTFFFPFLTAELQMT